MYITFDLKKLRSFSTVLLLFLGITAIIWLFPKYLDATLPVSASAATGYTLIIDAGHGGEDGGATGISNMLESEINLDVSLKARAIAEFLGVNVVMTRETQDIEYPDSAKTTAQRKVADQKSRVGLINSTDNAILVSIHQNCYTSAAPRGVQVLYGPTDSSQELATLMQANLTGLLYPENRRAEIPAASSIYIMNNVRCPAVLVECGFLSNPEESALLSTEEYRSKLAIIIIASLVQYI